MSTSIAPMKHRRVNKSFSSSLVSIDKQKDTKLKRTQDRKNKRLTQRLGA